MQLNIQALSKALPNMQTEIARLDFLLNKVDNRPRIAVYGKFNHGKSTLLNALIGQEIFAASDKRETVKNAEFEDTQHNVVWLDTPGLDADVLGKDDEAANLGAMTAADIVLLVHSIKAGELDKYEAEHFRKLLEQTSDSTQKLLVITQIDQVANESDKELALSKIQRQFPNLEIRQVSSVRYLNFKDKNPKAAKKSGIPALIEYLNQLTNSVRKQREFNKVSLINKIEYELKTELSWVQKERNSIEKEYYEERGEFRTKINSLFDRVDNL